MYFNDSYGKAQKTFKSQFMKAYRNYKILAFYHMMKIIKRSKHLQASRSSPLKKMQEVIVSFNNIGVSVTELQRKMFVDFSIYRLSSLQQESLDCGKTI